MVRWLVLASVPSLPFGTGEVGDVLHEELVRVVYQLLGVSHLRVEVAHDVQSVDLGRIGAVPLLLKIVMVLCRSFGTSTTTMIDQYISLKIGHLTIRDYVCDP